MKRKRHFSIFKSVGDGHHRHNVIPWNVRPWDLLLLIGSGGVSWSLLLRGVAPSQLGLKGCRCRFDIGSERAIKGVDIGLISGSKGDKGFRWRFAIGIYTTNAVTCVCIRVCDNLYYKRRNLCVCLCMCRCDCDNLYYKRSDLCALVCLSVSVCDNLYYERRNLCVSVCVSVCAWQSIL